MPVPCRWRCLYDQVLPPATMDVRRTMKHMPRRWQHMPVWDAADEERKRRAFTMTAELMLMQHCHLVLPQPPVPAAIAARVARLTYEQVLQSCGPSHPQDLRQAGAKRQLVLCQTMEPQFRQRMFSVLTCIVAVPNNGFRAEKPVERMEPLLAKTSCDCVGASFASGASVSGLNQCGSAHFHLSRGCCAALLDGQIGSVGTGHRRRAGWRVRGSSATSAGAAKPGCWQIRVGQLRPPGWGRPVSKGQVAGHAH